jgi:hypothetical protein
LGRTFLNAGNEILDGLELGSKFTWDLAHLDLLGKEPFFGTGPDTPYVAVFIGNQGYDGIASVANSPGSDGTVRWAGCGLNTRKITLDLTQKPFDQKGQPTATRVSISEWAAGQRLSVPVIAVDKRDHGTLIANPEPGMVELIRRFLTATSRIRPPTTSGLRMRRCLRREGHRQDAGGAGEPGGGCRRRRWRLWGICCILRESRWMAGSSL